MRLSEEYEIEYPESLEERVRMIEEIQMEIGTLVDIASAIIKSSRCSSAASRAKVYWIPHIMIALSSDHSYLGGGMCTMDDTIQEMREEAERD